MRIRYTNQIRDLLALFGPMTTEDIVFCHSRIYKYSPTPKEVCNILSKNQDTFIKKETAIKKRRAREYSVAVWDIKRIDGEDHDE